MYDAKLFADLITVTRGALGAVMIWFGLTQNREALSVVIPLMILCWTGDFVDGGLAHRSRNPRHTWIGDHDVNMDAFVSICLGIYLIGAGYVVLATGVVYLLFWTVVFMRVGNDRNLLMLAQAPIYLAFLLIALQFDPARGYLIVAWVATATALNWRRFSKDTVPAFLARMKSLRDDHSKPRHS
ncbi:MAG: hypothetical protein AB1750_00935 [Chloroflexota bacterium]